MAHGTPIEDQAHPYRASSISKVGQSGSPEQTPRCFIRTNSITVSWSKLQPVFAPYSVTSVLVAFQSANLVLLIPYLASSRVYSPLIEASISGLCRHAEAAFNSRLHPLKIMRLVDLPDVARWFQGFVTQRLPSNSATLQPTRLGTAWRCRQDGRKKKHNIREPWQRTFETTAGWS